MEITPEQCMFENTSRGRILLGQPVGFVRGTRGFKTQGGEKKKKKKRKRTPRYRSIAPEIARRGENHYLSERGRRLGFHGVAREQSPCTGDLQEREREAGGGRNFGQTTILRRGPPLQAFHHGNVMENNERNGPR